MMRYGKVLRSAFWLLSFLAVLLPSSLTMASPGDGGFEKEAGGYHFRLVFEEHPKTGPNEIELSISDPDGSPVTGATVEVTPVQASEEHTGDEAEPHGEAEGDHAEAKPDVLPGAHDEPAEESGHGDEAGHDDSSAGEHQETEGEAGSHAEVETEVHAETGGHADSESAVLQASGEAGRYTGKITFLEPGNYSVVVRVLLENETVEQELIFPVDVIPASPPWGVLSGFFGINLIVMAVAGFLKRKPAAAKS